MAALEKENKLQEAQIQAAKKSGKSGKRGKYVAKIPMNVDFEKKIRSYVAHKAQLSGEPPNF